MMDDYMHTFAFLEEERLNTSMRSTGKRVKMSRVSNHLLSLSTTLLFPTSIVHSLPSQDAIHKTPGTTCTIYVPTSNQMLSKCASTPRFWGMTKGNIALLCSLFARSLCDIIREIIGDESVLKGDTL